MGLVTVATKTERLYREVRNQVKHRAPSFSDRQSLYRRLHDFIQHSTFIISSFEYSDDDFRDIIHDMAYREETYLEAAKSTLSIMKEIARVLTAPLEDMPLFISGNDTSRTIIAQWRLEIGK